MFARSASAKNTIWHICLVTLSLCGFLCRSKVTFLYPLPPRLLCTAIHKSTQQRTSVKYCTDFCKSIETLWKLIGPDKKLLIPFFVRWKHTDNAALFFFIRHSCVISGFWACFLCTDTLLNDYMMENPYNFPLFSRGEGNKYIRRC